MIRTVAEARENVAYRESRLELAKATGRERHIAKCEDNLEGARWSLSHALKHWSEVAE